VPGLDMAPAPVPGACYCPPEFIAGGRRELNHRLEGNTVRTSATTSGVMFVTVLEVVVSMRGASPVTSTTVPLFPLAVQDPPWANAHCDADPVTFELGEARRADHQGVTAGWQVGEVVGAAPSVSSVLEPTSAAPFNSTSALETTAPLGSLTVPCSPPWSLAQTQRKPEEKPGRDTESKSSHRAGTTWHSCGAKVF